MTIVSLPWDCLGCLAVLDDFVAWSKNKGISTSKRFNAQEFSLGNSGWYSLEVADLGKETAHSK
jgi:hypothetical protein